MADSIFLTVNIYGCWSLTGGNTMSKNAFIKVDKRLFKPPYHDLKPDCKLAYALLTDRHSLSVNNEFVDEAGKTCVRFTEESMGDMLCCSRQKAGRIMRELQDRNMVTRYLASPGEAYYIYPLPLLQDVISTCDIAEHGDVTAGDRNNTDTSNTETSNTDQYARIKMLLASKWDYIELCQTHEDCIDVVDIIIDAAASIMCTDTDTLHIAGADRGTEYVQRTIMRLPSLYIGFIARRVKDNLDNIKDINSYIYASLFNSARDFPG